MSFCNACINNSTLESNKSRPRCTHAVGKNTHRNLHSKIPLEPSMSDRDALTQSEKSTSKSRHSKIWQDPQEPHIYVQTTCTHAVGKKHAEIGMARSGKSRISLEGWWWRRHRGLEIVTKTLKGLQSVLLNAHMRLELPEPRAQLLILSTQGVTIARTFVLRVFDGCACGGLARIGRGCVSFFLEVGVLLGVLVSTAPLAELVRVAALVMRELATSRVARATRAIRTAVARAVVSARNVVVIFGHAGCWSWCWSWCWSGWSWRWIV